MNKAKQRIAFEFARHSERYQDGPEAHRVRAYFRWVPVLDTSVPIKLANYDKAIVRIINQVTIINAPSKIVLMYPPELSYRQMGILVRQLFARWADKEIDDVDLSWGIAKIAESLRHDSSQPTSHDV